MRGALVDDRVDALGERQAGVDGVEEVRDLLGLAGAGRGEQVVQIVEVHVDRAERDPGPGGDLLGRGPWVAGPHELQDRGDDGLPGPG